MVEMLLVSMIPNSAKLMLATRIASAPTLTVATADFVNKSDRFFNEAKKTTKKTAMEARKAF